MTEYYLPLYFQSVKGASPSHSGVLILPITLTQSLIGIATSIVVHQTGRYRELIWAGVVLMTLGNGLYIGLGTDASMVYIIAAEIVAALGAGMLFQPPLIAVQALAAPEDTATATSTLGFSRGVATSLGVVIGSVIFQNGMSARESSLISAGLSSDMLERLSGRAAAANVGAIENLKNSALRTIVRGAFAASLRNVWILTTCTSACAVVASAFVVRRALSREHVEVRTGLKN